MTEAAEEIIEEVAKERPAIRKHWEKVKAKKHERAKRMEEVAKEILSFSFSFSFSFSQILRQPRFSIWNGMTIPEQFYLFGNS